MCHNLEATKVQVRKSRVQENILACVGKCPHMHSMALQGEMKKKFFKKQNKSTGSWGRGVLFAVHL